MTNLSGAHLNKTDLRQARFFGCSLKDSDLSDADIRKASIVNSNLTGTMLMDADLNGTIYEVQSQPPMWSIGLAKHLGYITWKRNSEPIYALRKSLADAGFKTAAQQVNAAIHRHDQNLVERFLFDWTCEWGTNWLRPLFVAAILSLLCTLI